MSYIMCEHVFLLEGRAECLDKHCKPNITRLPIAVQTNKRHVKIGHILKTDVAALSETLLNIY